MNKMELPQKNYNVEIGAFIVIILIAVLAYNYNINQIKKSVNTYYEIANKEIKKMDSNEEFINERKNFRISRLF